MGKPQEGAPGVGCLGVHGEGKGFSRLDRDRGIEGGLLDVRCRRAVLVGLDAFEAQISRGGGISGGQRDGSGSRFGICVSVPCSGTGDELEAQVQGRDDDVLRSREGKGDGPSGVVILHLDIGDKEVRSQIAGKGCGRIGERDGSAVQKVTVHIDGGLAELGFIQCRCRLYAGNAQ